MRTFEWILLLSDAAAVYLPVVLATRLRRGRMAAVLVVAVSAQMVLEGIRWQLWPVYLSAIGLAIGDVLWDERRVRGWPRVRRGLLGAIALPLLAALPIAFPVPSFPAPTGPYAVGTMNVVVVDSERPEIYGQQPSEESDQAPAGTDDGTETEPPHRRFMVQVWYPAIADPDAPREVWNPDWDVVGPATAERLGIPGFMVGHLGGVQDAAKPGLTMLSGRLPVVLYSHEWAGFRTIALDQMESLASHGYIVIAADHAYGALASRFPDGEVIRLDPAALPDPAEVDGKDYLDAADTLIETFSDDLVAIVDQLAAGEEGVFAAIADHVDLEHLGAFGHGAGGGAAVRFCIEDERCAAVLGQDPWVEPIPDRVVADELSQPSLFMRSDDSIDTSNDRRLRGLAERSEQESYWLSIDGTRKNDFVMAPLLGPVASRLGWKGPIAADRIIPIVDEYLVAFFDRYLFEFGGAVLDEPTPSEVQLEFLP